MEKISAELEECIRKEKRLRRKHANVKKRIAELEQDYDETSRKRARMASDAQLNGLEALPAEILCMIARNLEFDEVEYMRRVSRALYEKIDHDVVWKPVYGEVPEQKLPINKYHVALRLKWVRQFARIQNSDIFGRVNKNDGFFAMLRKVRPAVPKYLHDKLYGASFKNIGGVLFLCVVNPRPANFYKDLENLLRIGVIAIPKVWFMFYSEKIIFVRKPGYYQVIKGFLFTVATSDFRPLKINNLTSSSNYLLNVRDVDDTIEFKQYSHTDANGFEIFNYYSLDVGQNSAGECKLLKTGP